MARKAAASVQTFDDHPVSDPLPHSVSGAGTGRYRVSLECPTPLAHKDLEVEADSPAAARAAFDRANGISGSDHTYNVQRVG